MKCTNGNMKHLLHFILSVLFLCQTTLYAQQEFTEVATLPEELSETSGLLYLNGRLITHNDSGNEALLYEFDTTTGELLRRVEVNNATNIDWEDITQDEQFIYVGDFGNNKGDRRDLVIYKIAKSAFLNQNQVSASRISFSYEDQVDFSTMPNSDWDAEALFSIGEYLYILTKEWQSQRTSIYQLSKEEGQTTAVKVEEFNSRGLVTGATFIENSNQLVIVGYSLLLQPFILMVNQVPESPPFLSNANKQELEILPLQVESVASDGARVYFTNEDFFNSSFGIRSPARLFFFDLSLPNEPRPEAQETDLLLYSRYGSAFLNYQSYPENEPPIGYVIYDSSGREIRIEQTVSSTSGSIDVSTLASGIYHARFFYLGRELTQSFLKL